MDNMIFNPLEDYEKTYKERHNGHVEAFFKELEDKSRVNAAENRATVAKYRAQQEKADKVRKKAGLLKGLRITAIVVMVISVLIAILLFIIAQILPGVLLLVLAGALLAIVLAVLGPRIKNLNQIYEQENAAAQQLLQTCWQQMEPLNRLFGNWDGISLLEKTIPRFDFQPAFSVTQEKDMLDNYNFQPYDDEEHSVLDTLSGTYNANPFLYERRLVHEMGLETYHGQKTIYWTESYRDSNGRRQTRRRSQTLHATVTKPKPFYRTETKLYYGAQAGPDLSFTRDNKHLENKSDRAIDAMVRKGERKLQKKAEKALENNQNFMGMTNTEFDVLFDALDRDHEVQFRLLFTPLAQTNMVDLLRSETGYGDDFDFYKKRRMNTIVTEHSQHRDLLLSPKSMQSYDYDEVKTKFRNCHNEYFRSIYFDFAPLLALPVYQERPVHSLHPLPENYQRYSIREYEVLANAMDSHQLVHPRSRTKAILKAIHTSSQGSTDTVRVTAYSYDTIPRVDVVAVLGGDGRMHGVPVHWQEYLPLEARNEVYIGTDSKNANIHKHGLYARVSK
ncbi:MAG: hypothetical protein J6V34_00730 [Oscillospiraceae bacterium]|nr:hypothetical protein [Oscillospiraceae bacterium]